MPASTKDRIVGTTAELFRHQGYTGTGVKQIVAEARAPFGSVYHFFPGGKEELGSEVIRTSGAQYGLLGASFFGPDRDVVDSVRDFFAGAAQDLAASDYEDACPIATVALEISSSSEPMRIACAEVFEGWIAGLSGTFAAAGIDTARARPGDLDAVRPGGRVRPLPGGAQHRGAGGRGTLGGGRGRGGAGARPRG